MSKRYDAIIIGGGHNGLVNAAYLATRLGQPNIESCSLRHKSRALCARVAGGEIILGWAFSST